MEDQIDSTHSQYSYEFQLLINLPKRRLLSLSFFIVENMPTHYIQMTKLGIHLQMEIQFSVCSYKRWIIELLDVAFCSFQSTHIQWTQLFFIYQTSSDLR